MSSNEALQKSILEALAHSEAEDGLYFRNFYFLHPEDERPKVEGSKPEIIKALNSLLKKGKIEIDHDELETTFKLVT